LLKLDKFDLRQIQNDLEFTTEGVKERETSGTTLLAYRAVVVSYQLLNFHSSEANIQSSVQLGTAQMNIQSDMGPRVCGLISCSQQIWSKT